MREKPSEFVEQYRVTKAGIYSSTSEYGNNGLFEFHEKGARLRVLASDGLGWDHVSVSTPDRCPTWDEMCWVKSLFFKDDEWVIQYHPAKAEHINRHPFCLHLWRPQKDTLPIPPDLMV